MTRLVDPSRSIGALAPASSSADSPIRDDGYITDPRERAGTTRPYRVRIARTAADVQAAQRLRFRVFNLEMQSGIADAYATGRDADLFDDACDHLLVEETRTGLVVGTYRLQHGRRAATCHGYYSAQEFDLTPFEQWRNQILELGRASIDQAHRNFGVVSLLWTGIGWYARECGARYLMGCSSFPTTDLGIASTAWRQLQANLAEPALRTQPWPNCACPLIDGGPERVAVPKLLATYLSLGAVICAPPALDVEFGSVDFLTWIDLESPAIGALQARGRFARLA